VKRAKSPVRWRWVGLQRFPVSHYWPRAKRRHDPDEMTAAERGAVRTAVAAGADRAETTTAVTGVPLRYVTELWDCVVARTWMDRARAVVWFYRNDVRLSASVDLPPELVGMVYSNDDWPLIYNCRECCAGAGREHLDDCGLAPLHAALARQHAEIAELRAASSAAAAGDLVQGGRLWSNNSEHDSGCGCGTYASRNSASARRRWITPRCRLTRWGVAR
jgi:hypothetical protein